MPIPMNIHTPEKYATDTGREFDPSTEVHHFAFTVKIVDPGCTLELQIEERSGRITRLTTTDNPVADKLQFTAAVVGALRRAMQGFGI